MNVACPQCTSVFRVDPAKVPAGGVRARCSVCSGVINVPEPSFEETVATGAPTGTGGGRESGGWARVATPEGGWTPRPAAEAARQPAGPRPTPAQSTSAGAFAPPAPSTPSRTFTPPVPQEPTPPTPQPITPPAPAPAAQPTPPAPAAAPEPSPWSARESPAQSAEWGDWPPVAPPFAGPADRAPAAPAPSLEAWGTFGSNPLAPEMPTPAAAQPSPVATGEPEPWSTPPRPQHEPPASEAPAAPPEPEPVAAAEAPAEPEPAPEIAYSAPAGAADEAEAVADPEQVQEPAAVAESPAYEPSGTDAAPEPQPRTPQSDSVAGAHVNPFMRRDPHERARRLARALASDIVTYYPEKHAEGMRDGTLRDLFREEIKKSYDDYVAHVGADLAQSTTYFQDALNEVLAGGRRLF